MIHHLLFLIIAVVSLQSVDVRLAQAFDLPKNIIIVAPDALKPEITNLLAESAKSQVGQRLLAEISDSPHTLTIQHWPRAVTSAGKTLLPLSRNLMNGVGVSAEIQMNFEMPRTGSHVVLACEGDAKIAFTAVMNLIHELRHARDGMTGKFIGHRFEKDAVETENEFRQELGLAERRCLRDDENHIWQVWNELFVLGNLEDPHGYNWSTKSCLILKN